MLSVGALITTFALQGATAADIVGRSVDLLGRANSVVGVYTDSSKLGIATADFHLKKGTKLALIGTSVSELCNGNDRYTVDKKKKTYTLKDTRIFGIPYIVGMEAFTMNGKDTIAKTMSLEDVQMSQFDGKSVASYRVNGSTVFVDAQTALPVGASYGEGNNKHTYRFKNLRIDA
ncbi:MAG TPA: hypothetical protein VK171_15430, partial [Fimbriimonas sp.]|nr:hypothetical protein [Fimbriimonas sp.]